MSAARKLDDATAVERPEAEEAIRYAARLSTPHRNRLRVGEIGQEERALLESLKPRVAKELAVACRVATYHVGAVVIVEDGELHLYAGPLWKVARIVRSANLYFANLVRTEVRRDRCPVVVVLENHCFLLRYLPRGHEGKTA